MSYPELPSPDTPRLDEWLAAVELREGLVVLCHSLGCILWLQHAARGGSPAADRVLLVAPPSPRTELPGVEGFFPLNVEPGQVAAAARETRVVYADDDPYCPEGADRLYAEPLGLPSCLVAGGGHLNTDAGFGPWPEVEAWAVGLR